MPNELQSSSLQITSQTMILTAHQLDSPIHSNLLPNYHTFGRLDWPSTDLAKYQKSKVLHIPRTMLTVSLNIEQKHLVNSRFLYVVDFLKNHPSLKKEVKFSFNDLSSSMQIDYGKKANGSLFIPSLNHFFFQSSSDFSNLNQISLNFDSTDVCVLSNESDVESRPVINDDFKFDFFENIFFHISRYEEVFAAEKDKNKAGWLKEELQFLVQHNIQEIPVVDQLVYHFLKTIDSSSKQKKSSYQLTHDIDELYKFRPRYNILKTIAGAIFRRRDLSYLLKNISLFLSSNFGKGNDPYDVFNLLIDKDDIWEEKVVYFMTGGETNYDNKYNIHHPKVDEILKLARSRDYKVGIHPSYNSSINAELFKKERAILQERCGEKVSFSRQHWLRFDWEKTPYNLEKEGISKDSSMSYNHHLGFRCGTGFAYHLYDFKNEKRFQWLEQPLAFMESSLIHFCENNNSSILEITEQFIQKNKLSTCLCFNFHNSRFDTSTEQGASLKSFYKDKFKSLLSA